MTLPLTVDELGATLDAIGGFERRPFVAVAVSGGPDSLALTILADCWARARGGEVYALTVDHKLRPESAAEAQRAAGWLGERGIRHEILTWEGEKPANGLQEAARDARYRLLTDWCRERGCLHLLTAHHREDQAETYLIRQRAGSGVDGLAAMSAVREIGGCRIVRPLLGTPRARLSALLEAEGQPFITDPSNCNPRFERARLRLAIQSNTSWPGLTWPSGDLRVKSGDDGEFGSSGDSSLFNDTLAATHRHGRERIHRERDLDVLLARAVSLHPAGFAVLEPESIRTAPRELAERLLGRTTATIGGARYPLRRDRVTRLLAALLVESRRARTLGGCRFVPWRGRILVLREMAAAASPQRLGPGDAILWDRRFEVALPSGAERPVTVGYLGTMPRDLREKMPANVHASHEPLQVVPASPSPVGEKGWAEGGDSRTRGNAHLTPPPPQEGRGGKGNAGLPGLVRPVLPAVWNEAGLLYVPDLGCLPGSDGALPRLAFRPANPLSQAGFTVV